MKSKTLLIFISFAYLLFSPSCSCKKNVASPDTLPPATQEGKNTLGFLLNGESWTPQGVRGTGNLSIDYDPGFNQGIFNIVAYNFIPSISEQFTIGIKDSLNFIEAPTTFNISNNSLYVASFSSTCDLFSTFADVSSTGSLTISKLDRANHIISGTFNVTLSKTGCETITITDGRFDMKF